MIVKFKGRDGIMFQTDLSKEGAGLWHWKFKTDKSPRPYSRYDIHLAYDENGSGDWTRVSYRTYRRIYNACKESLFPQVVFDEVIMDGNRIEEMERTVVWSYPSAHDKKWRKRLLNKAKKLPSWVKK